jgi:hypothetical protein
METRSRQHVLADSEPSNQAVKKKEDARFWSQHAPGNIRTTSPAFPASLTVHTHSTYTLRYHCIISFRHPWILHRLNRFPKINTSFHGLLASQTQMYLDKTLPGSPEAPCTILWSTIRPLSLPARLLEPSPSERKLYG